MPDLDFVILALTLTNMLLAGIFILLLFKK